MTITTLYLENLTYSATEMRQLTTLLRGNQGVVATGDLAVSPGIALAVQIAAGEAIIAGTDAAGQGNYLFKSDAIVFVNLAAAPASGHSRIDLIVAQILDQDQNGGTSNLGEVVAVTGTSATTGSQVAPATPPTCIVLAQVLVGPLAGGITSGNITDERTFTGSPSGTLICTAQTIVASGGGSNTLITNMVGLSGTLKNGMTRSANGLLIPAGSPTRPYRVSYQLMWQAAAGGVTAAGEYVAIVTRTTSGTTTAVFSSEQHGAAGENPSPGGSVELPLAAGDLVQLQGFQTSGSPEASAFTNTPFPGDLTWLSVSAVPGSS